MLSTLRGQYSTMKVYLSSTLSDLGPERQAVKDVLGGECVVVEIVGLALLEGCLRASTA